MTERNIVLDKAARSSSKRKDAAGAAGAAGASPALREETRAAVKAAAPQAAESGRGKTLGQPSERTIRLGRTRTSGASSEGTPRHAKPVKKAAGGEAAREAPRVLKDAPTLEQLEKELKKERHRVNYGRVLRNTLFSLVVVSAVSVLVAMLLLPVLQTHGSSMTPTLHEGDIVVAVSAGNCKTGDLIAFYYNNNILIKRVIAGPGDWVDIDADGNVSVNGQLLEEPYVAEKARGETDLSFPYQVPDARFFVMGDHRATSIDSRSSLIGCVSREMLIGRIVLRVWPLTNFHFF